MGWGRGDQIFDQVADDLLELSWYWTRETCHEDIVIPVLENLYKQLPKLDWDNECESKYWEHPTNTGVLSFT